MGLGAYKKAKDAKMSELDAANAAPPASDTERKSALGWIAVIAVLGVIALIVAGVYSYKSHKAEVAKIEAAPVVVPPLLEPAKEKKRKTPTEKVAKDATTEPPKASFWSFDKGDYQPNDTAIAKPSKKVTDDESEITLPLAPIPPIPPQRSIP